MFPSSPEALTVEWLRGVFAAEGIQSDALLDVTSLRIGTGLIGENYRLTLTWEGEPPPGAPSTLVAKLPASDPTSRATGVGLRNYEREVRFYREVASDVGIRVARSYATEWDSESGDFLLLLEDLSPGVVGDQLLGCTVAEAEVVIDVASAFHGSNWESTRLADFGTWMNGPADEERAGQTTVLWTMALPQFLERHQGKLTDDELSLAERFGPRLASWLLRRDAPLTVVHGDFRIDNMLFGSSGSVPWMVPVDWQTPALGPAVADVAYFLGASLMPEDRSANEERLVRRWWDGLPDHARSSYDWDRAWADYRSLCFSGVVMGVVASFLTPQTERGDAMFFAMASRHLRQALELDAESLLPTD